MLVRIVSLFLAVSLVFASDPMPMDPELQETTKYGVSATVVRDGAETSVKIHIDLHADYLLQPVRVNFGVLDRHNEKHNVYARTVPLEELIHLQDAQGRIQIDIVEPVDPAHERDLVESLVAAGLLDPAAYLEETTKAAGSFHAYADVWTYINHRYDIERRCAKAHFSCTNCNIVDGDVYAEVGPSNSYDGCNNCPGPLNAMTCQDILFPDAHAQVVITLAEWPYGGSLSGYFLETWY